MPSAANTLLPTIDVSIIVCTWNRAHLLNAALEYFARLELLPGLLWELIIVDNNSVDNTGETVAAWSTRLPVRYVLERRQGLSHARNRGMAEARGRLLLFTDDDVFVEQGWLVACYQAALRNPRGGVFGGPVFPVFEATPDPDIEAAYPAVRKGLCGVDDCGAEGIMPGEDYIVGANFGVRRDAIEGLQFDGTLGAVGAVPGGGEEVAIQQAIRARGWHVMWTPSMRVQHYVKQDRLTVSYLRQFVYHRARTSVLVTPLPGAPTILGAPRWLWFHFMSKAWGMVKAAFAPTRVARLTALHDFDRARGLLRGSLESRQMAKYRAAPTPQGDRSIRDLMTTYRW